MKYTIYSVEDDKDISKIINRTLAREGYDITSFPDGKTFLNCFAEKKPDMILLDMMLPDYSGSDLLKMVRSNPANDDILVIIISANALVTDKIDGLDMGADDYIAKPFDLMELVARVNAKFRKYRRNTSYVVGDITLDVESHECKKSGENIPLTMKEFELFELLLKHRGKAVSRDEILKTIWGEEDLETRAIDMHIKSLRRKLGDEDLIETIYGMGYKIS